MQLLFNFGNKLIFIVIVIVIVPIQTQCPNFHWYFYGEIILSRRPSRQFYF